ncbi:polyphosphate kinase 2 family protein [Pedobacter sp. HMF7647]|uniref:Polyphosphate kinase 2 family protein n=1 Tax=Hufsiella arboris TaxID=2695275 RepID=A0A7K1Y7U6_9SPHI|nr:polyphosphate kinase 2 family protein [Hufsiella arboris]MXV50653.1 polyphosphate kinase 2 family protein [Hufsiella arboris]
MNSIAKKFQIERDSKLSLKKSDTSETGGFEKEAAEQEMEKIKSEMAQLQDRLYATDRYSLLIIFQAMDAAGKDSAIKHVMSGLNPQGCQVFSFKQPSSEDYDHDFLWRHYKALPEKGRIGIHNRSHYENVLVAKVHPDLLLKERQVDSPNVNKDFWQDRYQSIRDFEKHLTRNGTKIIKFFLNISKDEQKKRFLERIDTAEKNWKFSSFDLQERERWDDYMKAYEEAITSTSTDYAPWYVIPANKKWFARLAISGIIKETLESMSLKTPQLSQEDADNLQKSKEQLLGE